MQIDVKYIAKVTKTPSWKSNCNFSKTFLRTDHRETQNWLKIFKKMRSKKKKKTKKRKMRCFVFQLKYVMPCHFWKHKSLFLHVLHQYSVPSNINPLYFFLAQTLCTLVKSSPLMCKVLRFLSAQVKICQIPYVNFELTSQFLFNFCTIFHYYDTQLPCNF